MRSAVPSTLICARRLRREGAERDRGGVVRPELLDRRDDVRRDELAAVRDRGVEARHLQRRDGDVLLADRELDQSPGFQARSIAVLKCCLRQAGRRDQAGRVAADVEARNGAEAELLRPALHLRPVRAVVLAPLEVAVADVVEVRVARLRERGRERHRLVRVRVPVLERMLVEPVVRDRRALDVLVRREQAVRDRGERGQRLEGRARRILAGDRAVEARVVPLLRDLGIDERLELLRVDAADVDRRLVGRVGREREDRAVARVDRDDRAAVRVPLLVSPSRARSRAGARARRPAADPTSIVRRTL